MTTVMSGTCCPRTPKKSVLGSDASSRAPSSSSSSAPPSSSLYACVSSAASPVSPPASARPLASAGSARQPSPSRASAPPAFEPTACQACMSSGSKTVDRDTEVGTGGTVTRSRSGRLEECQGRQLEQYLPRPQVLQPGQAGRRAQARAPARPSAAAAAGSGPRQPACSQRPPSLKGRDTIHRTMCKSAKPAGTAPGEAAQARKGHGGLRENTPAGCRGRTSGWGCAAGCCASGSCAPTCLRLGIHLVSEIAPSAHLALYKPLG